MSDEVVLTARRGGVLELTLNRPDKLNAFNEAQHLALRAELERARDDDTVRAVLLTGAGRGFCAGQDLGDRDPAKMDGPPDLGHTIEIYYNPLIRLLRDLPKPVICAVNGVAAGAGAGVALNCDIVFAARGAKFMLPFCKLGLVPDAGSTYIMPRLIGEARAKALALTAEPIAANTAADWGLIWKAVDDAAIMDEARSLATALAAGPTYGLGKAKAAIQASAANDLDTQLDLERDLQRELGRTPDYAEGVSAFLQKRPAAFTGQKA